MFFKLQLLEYFYNFIILSFKVNEEPETKPNPSENEGHDSTKEEDPVQKPFAEPRNGDIEAIAQTGLGFTEASEEVYTPGTLSIVEIHPTSTPG